MGLDGSASYSQNANSAQTITHTFTAPGHYVVDLRIRDAAGLTADAQQTIDVRQAPPAGEVGVSIDNGAYATNNPHVQLDLVWPAGANQAIASNDGASTKPGATQTLALAPRVNWTLEQTGPDRLPKTVYVRFLGAGVDISTFTDDIILDQTPPQLSSAQLIGPAATAQATVAAASRKLRRTRSSSTPRTRSPASVQSRPLRAALQAARSSPCERASTGASSTSLAPFESRPAPRPATSGCATAPEHGRAGFGSGISSTTT